MVLGTLCVYVLLVKEQNAITHSEGRVSEVGGPIAKCCVLQWAEEKCE